MNRPMLAAAYNGEILNFPLLATPKVDGVRALVINGNLVSRSFKSIPNVAIRSLLEHLLPEGADGELSVNFDFQETISVVMSVHAGVPENLRFYWFDWVQNSNLDVPYERRVSSTEKYAMVHEDDHNSSLVIPLIPRQIHNLEELASYEAFVLGQGFEGVVLRVPGGKYKCGRSTMKEALMIKVKRYEDYEATVVGTEELMHNLNEKQKDNFGKTKRSSTKQGKLKSGTLGAIVAITDEGYVFKIGTGYTSKQRSEFWTMRDELIGKLVKYRHATLGKSHSGVPKSTVFLGIRHKDDT